MKWLNEILDNIFFPDFIDMSYMWDGTLDESTETESLSGSDSDGDL